MYKAVAAFAILLGIGLPATAEILAVCATPKGHGYFLPGPAVPADDAGWHTEAISNGMFQLLRNGDDYDVVFTDATGATLSAKGDGAKIAASKDATGNLLLIVFYASRVLETYVFWFGVKGNPTVTFSQAKYGTPISKHSLMTASCKWKATQ